MRNSFVGTPMLRREDPRLLRGRGQYVDDISMPDLLYAVVLRSSIAHGKIVAIHTAGALAQPGVHGIITGQDFPDTIPVIPTRVFPRPEFKPFEQAVIARDKVRYVGEPIAVLLADSIAAGEDALEHIELQIDDLLPVTDRLSSATGNSLLFEASGSNRPLICESRKGDADAAFATADYVRREHFKTGRHYSHTMEPRGLLATWDEAAGKLTVYGAAKVPYQNRRMLSGLIGLPLNDVNLIENDVGGGFGARGEFYPEDFLIPFAARRFGRPVKWIEDRRENLMATNHARDQEAIVEVACSRDGTILGLRGEVHTDMGAYMRTNGAVGAINACQFLAGPYRIENVQVDSHLWMTNKTPVGTYRGPGRFEACYFFERMIDIVAQDLGIDRIELRRRNLVRADEQPYPLAMVQPIGAKEEYDSGDYHAALDRALEELDWPKLGALEGRLIDGKYHGLGISCFIEGGAGGPKETARFEVNPDGTIALYIGSSSVGQGVETVFAQIAADALEVPVEQISNVFHGSTTTVSEGFGSSHCRSTVMGGSAVLDAAENFKTMLREAAAKPLECPAADVSFEGDRLTCNNRSIPLTTFAGLTIEGEFVNKKHTYAYGTHVCHITVDAKTGRIEILDYVAVEDVGRVVNPLTLNGQIIGSLVQGLGGSVLEHLIYDENGQLLTGSLADYLLPTATDFQNLRCVLLGDYPSPINPLGVKGAGEGGTIAAGGCIANAVGSALRSLGVQPVVLPLSSSSIWELMQTGTRAAAE